MRTRILNSLALSGILLSGVAFATPAHAAPDGWITTKAKLQLLTSDGVSGTNINVDTNDGAVVLHGKVPTEMEKHRAEALTREIDGVKSVKNLLQVVPPSQEKVVKQADEKIKDAAEKAIKADKAFGDVSVVSVNEGVVLLRGETDSLDQHLRAVRQVARINGVRRVASEIKTDDDRTLASATTAGTTVRDGTSVREDAKNNAREAGRDITAKTNEVTDKSKEKWDSAKDHTREAGHKTASTSSDARITSAAKLRMIGDSKVPALDVNVDTDDGVVTLFGIVPNAAAKAAAEADVRKVSGVVRVKNELQVVANSERKVIAAKDDDIEKNVSGAFKNLKDFEKVDVDAKNGVVRLTGEVATLSDKVRAATIARSQTGVRAVEEDLKVER
ncbi:MAG: BON domain-containing protein [Myxococcota bacterium]